MLRPYEHSGPLRDQDQLLDLLVQSRLTVGDFIEKWLAIETRAARAEDSVTAAATIPPASEDGRKSHQKENAAEASETGPSATGAESSAPGSAARRDASALGEPAPVAPTIGGRLQSLLMSLFILSVHVACTVATGLAIEEVRYLSRSVSGERLTIALSVAGGFLLVLGGFWLHVRDARNGKPNALAFYKRVFPRWYGPRSAYRTISLGLLVYVGITIVSFVDELSPL